MGEQLAYQLREACCRLDDKLVTARKKAEEDLRHLLSNQRLVTHLNQASSRQSQPGGDFSWQDVFQYTTKFLRKEEDKLGEDEKKEKQAKSAEANRQARRRTVAGTLRLVVRKGRDYLAWDKVVTCLLEMLQQPRLKDHYCQDLVRLLVEAVSNPKARALLRPGDRRGESGQWVRLLSAVRELVDDAPLGLESLSLAQVLHLTLQQGSRYTDLTRVLVRPDTWRLVTKLLLSPDTFARPESEARLEVVRAANCLLRRAGGDCRELACRMGEETMQAVLRCWADRKVGGEVVLEFVQLQMSLHHPLGASAVSEGQMVVDKEMWVHQLSRIYKNLIETTVRNRVRNCRVRGSRKAEDFELGNDILKLGVGVIKQLLNHSEVDLGDVTQLVPLDITQQTQVGPAAKRRRVSSDDQRDGRRFRLQLLLEELMSPVEHSQIGQESKIPWLQLLAGLITTYPAMLSEENKQEILRVLASLLQTSRSAAVKRHVLGVARGLLLASDGPEVGSDWDLVGRTSLNMLTMNQAGLEGHSFLRVGLVRGVVRPNQVYQAYGNRLVRRSNEAVRTLTFLLERHPLQDPAMVREDKDSAINRGSLLSWLLPQEEQEGSGDVWGVDTAKLITILVHKKVVVWEGVEDFTENCCYGELEKQLLAMSAVTNIEVGDETRASDEGKDNLLEPIILADLMDSVEGMLVQEVAELMDQLNNTTNYLVCTGDAICLVQTILTYLSMLKSSATCKLANTVRRLLNKAGEVMVKMLGNKHTRDNELLPDLSKLLALLNTKPSLTTTFRNLLYDPGTLSPNLFELLEKRVENLCQAKDSEDDGAVQQNQTVQQSNGGGGDPFDDPFDDFDSDPPVHVEVEENEMETEKDPEKDRQDLKLAAVCLSILAVLPATSESTLARQGSLVGLLDHLMDSYKYSQDSLDLVPRVVVLLVGSEESTLSSTTVRQMVRLLKNLAKHCMTQITFNFPGVFVLVKLLGILAPTIHNQPEGDSSRAVLLKVLGGLFSQNEKANLSRLGPDVMVELVEVLGLLNRSGADWAVWPLHNKVAVLESPLLDLDTDLDQPLSRCLPRFLAAAPAVLRLAAARQLLDMPDHIGQLTTLEKELIPAITTALQCPTTSSDGLSRAGTGCSILCSVTKVAPIALALPVLSCLLRLARRVGEEMVVLDKGLMTRAVRLVTDNMGLSPKEAITNFLPGLLWNHEGDLNTFPMHLLGYEDVDQFNRDYESVVVPWALLRNPSRETLLKLSEVLGKDLHSVLKDNFVKLALFFLPGIASDKNLEGKQKMRKLADYIEEEYKDKFGESVLKEAAKVLPQILLSVNDPSALRNTFKFEKITLLGSNPPRLASLTPSKVLNLLDPILSERGLDFWQYLSRYDPEAIARIAVTLTSTLSDPVSGLRTLHSLHLWLDSLALSVGGDMLPFFPFLTKYITSSLLSHINSEKTSTQPCMVKAILIVLHRLVTFVISHDPTSLHPVLYSLTYCLVGLSSSQAMPDICGASLNILKEIYIVNDFHFEASVSILEPFPPESQFDELRTATDPIISRQSSNLESCVERFLKVEKLLSPVFLAIPLTALKARLAKSDDEFLELLSSPALVRRLLVALVRSVKHKLGPVSQTALQCLGEIGPVDLSSPLLEEDEEEHVLASDYALQPAMKYVKVVLKALEDLLVSIHGPTSRAAAKAITNILSLTKEGQEFLSPPPGGEHTDLQAFLASLKKTVKNIRPEKKYVDEALFLSTMDNPSLWTGHGTKGHDDWLTGLVCSLLACFTSSTLLHYLIDICQLSVSLCETVLPFIVHELLLQNSNDIRLVLSAKFCNFFKEHFDSKVGSVCPGSRAGTPLTPVLVDKTDSPSHLRTESLRCMLAVVSYLRRQPLATHLKTNVREQNCWENNDWLAQLNFLHCAQAALSCGAYFSACQLCTVWSYQAERRLTSWSESDHLEGSLMEHLSSSNLEEGEAAQNIMYQASHSLGDKDAAVGAGRTRLADPATRAEQLAMEHKFSVALPLFDTQALALQPGAREGLMQALYSSGMHMTLSRYLATAGEEVDTGRLTEFQQECHWRLEKWDKFTPDTSRQYFHGCVLGGLESCVRGDQGAVGYWRREGEARVADSLATTSLESTASLYPFLTQLRQLVELERLAGVEHTRESLEQVLDSMVKKDGAKCPDFKWLEPVLTQRQLVLSTNRWSGGEVRKHVRSRLDQLCLEVSRMARKAEAGWVCNQQQRFLTEQSLWSRHEESLVAWAQGQHETAILLSKRLLLDIEDEDQIRPEAEKLRPRLLLNLGRWLDQQKSEPSSTILNKYLLKSVEELRTSEGSVTELVEAHMAIASFADLQYKQVKDYVNSPEFQERMQSSESNKEEAEILKKERQVVAIRQSAILKEKFSNMDQQEMANCQQQAEEYLTTSMEHYLAVLAGGSNTQPLAVYRLVALWFTNQDTKGVLDLLHANLPSVPSHKFIPLLYQMAARMELPKQGKSSASLLFNLILRCAEDHPHHAVPIVMALSHAKEDEKQEKVNGVNDKNGGSDDPREKAAENLLIRLEKNPAKTKMVQLYRHMLKGLIELAYVEPADKRTGKEIPFPKDQSLLKVSNWTEVTVPTDSVLVRPDRDYSSVCGVMKWVPTFGMVGGINVPKKLTCVGTDGRRRLQLVKGKDDLRQDAVMEQVFGLTNQLLDQNERSRRRGLRVRTYKVVPLSQRSGVLEWCVDTLPLAAYLVGDDNKSGAHKRYFPRELDSMQCRSMMHKVCDLKKGLPLKVREATFREVCRKFSPVMKFFFFEKFPSPGSYYLARTAYTKSVATNSMVGHILGLGDRHINNILIDQSNGELIHIDLGVAFEQGKILPHPENIPFRLTRDIVDGMGPTGVEGVFRQACEVSLGVLRSSKSCLLTVLEVLLHDPLFSWSVGPGRAAARQEQGKWEELKRRQVGQGNRMATRALLVLAAKLDGREEGATLSVEGQVSTLIQRARDPVNLCSVFPGWSPFC